MEQQLGENPENIAIFSRQMFTTRIVCACGEPQGVMRPQRTPMKPRWSNCGHEDPTRFRTERARELTQPDRTLGEYGIPDLQILEASVGATRYFALAVIYTQAHAHALAN